MMGFVLPVVALALVALIGWRTGKIKTRKGQGKLIAAFLVVWMLLSAVENFFPIENLFLTFHSPEAAYRFQSSGVTDIQVIEGEQSAFVWGTDKDDAIAFRIIPKTDKGWKCSGVFDVDFPTFYPDSGIEVNIFRHKRRGLLRHGGKHAKEEQRNHRRTGLSIPAGRGVGGAYVL